MAELIKERKSLEKNYKNNALVYRDIKEKFGNYYDYKVRCYTSYGDDVLYTDLEVDVFSSEEYKDSITVATIEEYLPKGYEFHWETVDVHRKELESLKKRLYKYLNEKLDNVEYSEDYTQ